MVMMVFTAVMDLDDGVRVSSIGVRLFLSMMMWLMRQLMIL
jgi:hypothetical protein